MWPYHMTWEWQAWRHMPGWHLKQQKHFIFKFHGFPTMLAWQCQMWLAPLWLQRQSSQAMWLMMAGMHRDCACHATASAMPGSPWD
jgi:hypothetical protein